MMHESKLTKIIPQLSNFQLSIQLLIQVLYYILLLSRLGLKGLQFRAHSIHVNACWGTHVTLDVIYGVRRSLGLLI